MKRGVVLFAIVLLFLFAECERYPELNLSSVNLPEKAGMDSKKLARIDAIVKKAIERGETPGAVVLIGRKGYIVYRKAFGFSRVIPDTEKMTVNTIFDLASLTKPIATASSIMKLVEEGKIRLWDPVTRFFPSFKRYRYENGKEANAPRIYHLLTHTSGLPPYIDIEKVKAMYGPSPERDSTISYILRTEKIAPPGSIFKYSCLGYVLLAEIVKKVSGEPISTFAVKNIFKPLGMRYTMFCPPDSLFPMISPTEVIDGKPLHGIVHDPLARLLRGISGNAGLFSNANDLAIFAQMMLNKGRYGNVVVFSPLTVSRMTEVYPLVKFSGRGLGWDIFTDYSSNRGDIFPVGSYGHTGFTGTSIWIDPETETFVIILTNRVHLPHGNVIRLRSLVASVVAGSIMEIR